LINFESNIAYNITGRNQKESGEFLIVAAIPNSAGVQYYDAGGSIGVEIK
jgi:hypothetical protein